MPLFHERPYQTFTQWLTFRQHRQEAMNDLARFVKQDPHWPKWQGRHGLRAYLETHNASLLPYLEMAWEAYIQTFMTRR
jgi:hypothetical protein